MKSPTVLGHPLWFASNQPTVPFCAGVLVIEDGRVLLSLGERADWRRSGGRLTVPVTGIGGGQESGENMRECAEREAAEETGTAVELVHSPVTFVEVEGQLEEANLAAPPPAPLLYQIQRRENAEPYCAGLPSGEWLHLAIYRALLLGTIPLPHGTGSAGIGDTPGLMWVPLPTICALQREGLTMRDLEQHGVTLMTNEAFASATVFRIFGPSTEALLCRVVERFGLDLL